MTGAKFTTRLQMYLRVDQLLVVLLLLAAWAVIAVGDNAVVGVFTAFFATLAMWAAVPAVARYRAFGLPLRLWLTDAVISVHVVVVLFTAVWFSADDGVWGIVGILVADVAVTVGLVLYARPVTRGDLLMPGDRVAGWERTGGDATDSPSSAYPGTAPPWRLVYVPVGGGSGAGDSRPCPRGDLDRRQVDRCTHRGWSSVDDLCFIRACRAPCLLHRVPGVDCARTACPGLVGARPSVCRRRSRCRCRLVDDRCNISRDRPGLTGDICAGGTEHSLRRDVAVVGCDGGPGEPGRQRGGSGPGLSPAGCDDVGGDPRGDGSTCAGGVDCRRTAGSHPVVRTEQREQSAAERHTSADRAVHGS